jgi:polyisoprenoid-binding protein YceI
VRSAALGALFAIAGGAQAQAPNYVIDPTHTFVNYEIGHFGTTTNRGRFSTRDGTLFFDRPGQTGKVEIVMDISSINTGVDFLNRQMQGKDFFNVADYPTGKFEVSGKLNIKGTVRDLLLPVTITQNGANSTATGSFNLKRLEFKIGEGEWADTTVVANDVKVGFKLVFTGLGAL